MVFEIIRWVSLALLWLVMILNVWTLIRGIRLNKRTNAAFIAMQKMRPVYCHECAYHKDAKVNDKGFLICPASGMEITNFDFCSYAEREEATDGEESELQTPVEATRR